MRKLSAVVIGFLGVMAFSGLTLARAEMGSTADMRSISGFISSIDIKNGRMQLRSDGDQNTRGISLYTVNLSKTLVTNTSDSQYLVVKDLEVNQHVTVELIDSPASAPEEVVARNIIVNSGWEAPRAAEAQYVVSNDRASLVGPRGSVGSAGPAGSQGTVGPMGPTGNALRGPRGEAGPAGAQGEQGFTGPRGPAGDLARGPVGAEGPSGPRGQQGGVGSRGEQGGSAAGFAGPAGAAGPIGDRGPTGDAGSKGSTLIGPTGPAGFAGSAGQRGSIGATGSKGGTSDGASGLTGPSGPQGPRGGKGETGNQGFVGRVGYWELYKEFNFASNQTGLSSEDMNKVNDIAQYVRQNPSLQVGIDGTAVRSSDQNQNDLRVNAIRSALIDAGVSPDRIKMGVIGARDLRREGRIAVMFSTI